MLHPRLRLPVFPLNPLATGFAIAVLIGLGGLARPAVAGEPRLRVVDLSKQQLPAPYANVDLADEVGRTLQSGGCTVERSCKGADCLTQTAAPSGVHVMTFDVTYDRQRYSCAVAVEVRDRAAGRLLYKENSSSAVCPAADLLEHTQRAARVACEELRKGQPDASAPAPVASLHNLEQPALRRSSRPGRGLPIAALGVGVGAVAAGAALLYMDGSDSRCRDLGGMRDCAADRHTIRYGIPLVLVGAGMAGWGIFRLASAPETTVAVGLMSNGVVVGGKF